MKLHKNLSLVIFFCVCCQVVQAQVAGKKAFAFLNLPASARQLALGSNFISSPDNDLSMAWNNPAALSSRMHHHVFASYNNYISDINSGYFSYARHFDQIGSFALGIHYTDYGRFEGYTPAGIPTGTFTAQDQCFHLSYGRPVKERFRIGASLKYAYSIYESYVSNALAGDISGIYEDTARRMTLTAYARNLGIQTIPFSGTGRQGLPFELALSLSKRLEHLPFRYHLILNNLQRPDMRYNISQTGEKDENGDPRIRKMSMGDNILRHLSLGGELNLSKHLVVRFGYRHQVRKEMTQEQRRGASGFSWGLGFRVSKFHLSYGSAAYFPGFNSNQFSLLMNLGDFYSKKTL